MKEAQKAPNLHSSASRINRAQVDRMHFPKIAALVKKERAEQGISLRELAELTRQFAVNPKTGRPPGEPLSHQQILRVERGICSVESALLVLKALDVPKALRAKVVTGEMYRLAMAS